jgi:hypothetical protein
VQVGDDRNSKDVDGLGLGTKLSVNGPRGKRTPTPARLPARPVAVGPRGQAARALLGWSRAELASRAGLSTKSLQRLDDGVVNPRASSLEGLGRVLTEGGVVFLAEDAAGGEGVRRVRTRAAPS